MNVSRVKFESPGHLDIWHDDGPHVIVYAPVGGVVNIRIDDTDYTIPSITSDRDCRPVVPVSVLRALIEQWQHVHRKYVQTAIRDLAAICDATESKS